MTISFGAKAGVTVGMTGKLQSRQLVQGREMEFTVAKFRVTGVSATSATAEITAGNASEVVSGLRARFDQKLVKSASSGIGGAPAQAPAPEAEDRRQAEAERRRAEEDRQRAEEERMMAEASAEDVDPGPRRDPEEIALELLQNELGARKIGD